MGRIVRVLAVLSSTWPGSPDFVAAVELKIDFCGTTAIRSPIVLQQRRRAHGESASVVLRALVEASAAYRAARRGVRHLGSPAVSGPAPSPGYLPEN
jgi:hypothetical protein